MQQHTDVYDSKGNLLLVTLGIDTDAWDELYPTWAIALIHQSRLHDTRIMRAPPHAHEPSSVER